MIYIFKLNILSRNRQILSVFQGSFTLTLFWIRRCPDPFFPEPHRDPDTALFSFVLEKCFVSLEDILRNPHTGTGLQGAATNLL